MNFKIQEIQNPKIEKENEIIFENRRNESYDRQYIIKHKIVWRIRKYIYGSIKKIKKTDTLHSKPILINSKIFKTSRKESFKQ